MEQHDIREPLPRAGDDADERPRRPLPRWKKLLLAVAGVLVVVGLVLAVVGEGDAGGGDAKGGKALPPGALGSNLVDGGGTGPASPGGDDAPWSPALMKMGFSFFVGFSVGYLFRAFLKIALLVCGLQFLILFGLDQADLVTVNWSSMEKVFDDLMARLRGEAGHVKTLLTGSLPAAGLGALGLVTGFRKN